MPRSLGLAAYMTLARRAEPAEPWIAAAPRPGDDVLWAHSTSPARSALLCHLWQRLRQQRPDLSLLLTGTIGVAAPRPGVMQDSLPAESLRDIRAFLEHYRPTAGLWTGGGLRPALISEAAGRGIPMMLIDADEAGFEDGRFRWLPDITRSSLRHFTHVCAASANAAQRLLKLGVAAADLTMTGPLDATGAPPDPDPTERDRLARLLAGRPIWLAAHLAEAELAAVIGAHRLVLRGAHRQILILSPEHMGAADRIAATLGAEDWRLVRRSRHEDPTEATQILLADRPDELALWYRLAPVSFIGGSLVSGIGGHDPLVAAALGSAVLYGPNVGRDLATYSRLAGAGAARIVKDAETLAAAVQRLNAPDQSAAMATAAWDIVTRGAEATDRVLDRVQDMLDLSEAAR